MCVCLLFYLGFSLVTFCTMLQKMQLLFFSPGLLNQLVLGIVNPTGVRMGGYGERGG